MRRLLDWINYRHPWDHNEAFYPWILNHLPEKRRLAIDVGCGRGELLLLLGQHFPQVIGVEKDPAMILASQQRCAGYSHVKVTDSLENCAPQSDLITMVASLHHMEIEETLEHVVDKLAPGGTFLCVGLARSETLTDLCWELASTISNPVIGWVKHPWPTNHLDSKNDYPTVPPDQSLGEISRIAHKIMPGVRVRRHLAFRYTMEWRR